MISLVNAQRNRRVSLYIFEHKYFLWRIQTHKKSCDVDENGRAIDFLLLYTRLGHNKA